MGRSPNGTDFLTPLTAAGTQAPRSDVGRGYFELEAGTYYVPIGGEDSALLSAMSQWGATGTITTITVEETDAPREGASKVTDYAASEGNWFPVPSTRVEGAVNGDGTSTATNGVLAHTAAGAGGGIQNIKDTASRRLRLAIVVATTVSLRVFAWAKE